MDLDIKTIRTFWTLVEASNPYTLSKLPDSEIVRQLVQQIESISSLGLEETQILSKYIGARTLLIKDLAYSKIDVRKESVVC